jgi:hypothetical protein
MGRDDASLQTGALFCLVKCRNGNQNLDERKPENQIQSERPLYFLCAISCFISSQGVGRGGRIGLG